MNKMSITNIIKRKITEILDIKPQESQTKYVYVKAETQQPSPQNLIDLDPAIRNLSEMSAVQRRRHLVDGLTAFSQSLSASYIIYKEGEWTYAINGTTGKIDYSGSDAATVIQAAHDALPIQDIFGLGEGSGGKILIKAGIYYISKTLNISTPHVTIEGEGPRTTILVLSNNADTNVIHIIHTAGQEGRRVRISNIMIDGNKTNNAAGYGIYTDNDISGDLQLYNIYIMRCKQSGIYWQFGNSVAHDVYIEACDEDGWKIRRAKNSVFTACSAWECTDYGFNITALWAMDSRFIGCHASVCGRGFNIQGSDVETPITFVGCVSKLNKTYGYIMGDTRGIILDGCISKDDGQDTHNTYSAIWIGDGGASTHSVGNTIIGCQIISTLVTKPKYGIEESSADQDYNIIIGNKITPMGTATMNILGVHSEVHFNIGYITEKAGNTTVLSGTTSIAVNLSGQIVNVSGSPTTVIATPNTNTIYSGTTYYVNTYNSGSFTINTSVAPTDDLVFSYEAKYKP